VANQWLNVKANVAKAGLSKANAAGCNNGNQPAGNGVVMAK